MSGYNGKVFRRQGGNEIVVMDGGRVTVQPGGVVENEGDALTAVTFDSDYFTVADNEVTLKAEVAALLAIVEAIPTVDPEDSETIWLDNGVLKVASAGN